MSVVLPSGFETVKLSAIFKKVSRRNNKSEIKNVITNSAEYGLIPQRDFFDKDIAVDGNTSNYYVSPAGVHTLGAGLYRFPAVARAVLSAGGGKEAGLIWHS